jgi:uncharacterized protein YkwD/outer membrane protein OmpA-like peptidoglycan-associated protein
MGCTFIKIPVYFLKICLVASVLFLPQISSAQEPNQRVHLSSPNFKYIEHLIKQKVDSIRTSNNLPKLLNDTSLYLSSRDHARYLTRIEDLSHYQSGSRRKRTYHERAIRYGAEDFYVSENIGLVQLANPLSPDETRLTNNQAANYIIKKWLASEGSIANILAPSHALVGLASWYDKEKFELRVASSFAAVTNSYKPHSSWDYFPYSFDNPISIEPYRTIRPERRYDWGINPKPSRDILDNYKKRGRIINTMGIIIRNDSVFVVFNNVRKAETLFQGKTDGLALEIIPNSYYSCATKSRLPIRREEEFTVKGEILQPVYRDYLLEKVKDQKRKPKVDLRYIASIPKDYVGKDYSINLIVLVSNRIADIVTINHPPAKVFDVSLSLSPAKDKFPSADLYIPRLRRDTLMLRVYFEQNKSDIMPFVGKQIRNWVQDKEIQRAAVYAYASVEGTERINRALSERRANEMIVFFNPSDGKPVVPTVITRENWFDFFRDVKDSKYNFLTNLDTNQIRNYVNDKVNSRELEPILARQRFTDLKILAYKIVNDVSIDGLAISEYNNLYNQIKKECANQPLPCAASLTLLQRMELVQLFLLNRNIIGRVSWENLDKLPIGTLGGDFDINSEPLAKLYYNKYRFILSNRGENLSHIDSLHILSELNKFPFPDPIIAYNYFVTLTRIGDKYQFQPFYQQKTLNEIQGLISKLEQISFNDTIVNEIRLFYHFKKVEQEYFINRLGDFETILKPSLDFIAGYYKQNSPTLNFAKDLSMFFSAFQRYDDAMQIIEPFAVGNPRDNEAFTLYIKYFYANPRVKQSTDFYQLLKDASDILNQKEWCNLFRGKWPINIQVLDHEPLFITHCRMCKSAI